MTVYFTREHEWIRLEGDVAVVGISDHAQEQLGDIVFVELPEVGKKIAKGDVAAVVESVKAASEVFAPVAGEVVEVNDALSDGPGAVNEAAEGEGWILKLKDGNELLGLIASETADEVALKIMGGIVVKYPKSQIVSRAKQDQSLMTPGLYLSMTEQELVDLVEYLTTLKKK